MKTRALTIDETTRLDTVRARYLDDSVHARDVTSLTSPRQALEQATSAWDAYVAYLEDHSIIPTLAGYRKRLVSA